MKPPFHFRRELDTPIVSAALVTGVPVKIVSEQAGHATSGFTMDVYGHVGDRGRKAMSDAIGAAFAAALAAPTGEQLANSPPQRGAALPRPRP